VRCKTKNEAGFGKAKTRFFCYTIPMRILGIDPGYDRLGVAILEKDSNKKEVLLHSACVQTSSKLPFSDRLFIIGETIDALIQKYAPHTLAIEKLYFQNNQKTAMYVSQTIGMLVYIAKKYNLEIFEYTPLQIKSACTGNGRANKKQIISMIPHIIKIEKEIQYDDEYDAIACGITHCAYIGNVPQ